MTTELTKAELQQYEDVKNFIVQHREEVYQWALKVRMVKEAGWWKRDADTWEEWCDKFCAKSASAIRKIIWQGHEREARKLIKETTTETVPKQEHPDSSRKPKQEKVIDVSAKTDTQASPAEMHKPPDPPRTEKLSADGKLKEVEKVLDHISHLQIDYNLLKLICRCLCDVKEVRSMLQPTLPMEVESSKKRSKGTLEECVTYCKLKGLLQSDGEWFFHKCVGAGWKNNGQPINDWQATVNAWQLSRVFPSQKGGSYQTTTRNSGPGQSNPGRNEGTFNKNPSQYRDVGRVA